MIWTRKRDVAADTVRELARRNGIPVPGWRITAAQQPVFRTPIMKKAARAVYDAERGRANGSLDNKSSSAEAHDQVIDLDFGIVSPRQGH